MGEAKCGRCKVTTMRGVMVTIARGVTVMNARSRQVMSGGKVKVLFEYVRGKLAVMLVPSCGMLGHGGPNP